MIFLLNLLEGRINELREPQTEILSKIYKRKVNNRNLNRFTKNNPSHCHNNKSNSKLGAMLKL
jgi:hypothetical protein